MKSIMQVLSANMFVTIIGILQTFLLPLILSPLEYGYWSLYLLYVSYAGFILFGFCDGFYLKHGGITYKNLDKQLFSFFHLVLLIYLIIVLLVWELIIMINISDDRQRNVLLLIGVGGFLLALRSYFVLLNQAMARFKIYSFGVVIEKIIILLAIMIFFTFPDVNSFYIILASVLGKLLTIIYFAYQTKEIIFSKTKIKKIYIRDSWDNIKVGFSLTLSGVGIMLISGFGRFYVGEKLGIIELGLYSFMFTISLVFTQTILAVSSVLFPILKRVAEEKARNLLEKADELIIDFSILILLLYYPVRFILEIIFLEYTSSMSLLIFLFPIIVSQTRMSLIFNTLYKIFRYEKQLMFNVLYSLIVCILLTITFFEIYNTKESIALATYLSFISWNMISIYFYNRLKNRKINIISNDVIFSVIFIVLNMIFGYNLYTFFTLFIVSISYLWIKKNKVKDNISQLKK